MSLNKYNLRKRNRFISLEKIKCVRVCAELPLVLKYHVIVITCIFKQLFVWPISVKLIDQKLKENFVNLIREDSIKLVLGVMA